MAVYVNETSDGDLRIVRAGEDVRQPVDADNTVTIAPTTPDWYARIAREHGYTVPTTAHHTMTDGPEVASD